MATLATAVDQRHQAMVIVAAYCGLRAGGLIGLHRHRVDLLHRRLSVIEQVQWIRRWLRGERTEERRRSPSRVHPGIVHEALENHLSKFAEPGREGILSPVPEGGYLRFVNFRRSAWSPAVQMPDCRRCGFTICATPAPRWPSLRGPM